MANDLLRLAWKAPIKKGPKMVLIALADAANKAGECWPSRRALARKAECAESTVSRHVQALVSLGVVEQIRRRRQSATYRVLAAPLEALQDVSRSHILMSDSSSQDVPEQDISTQDVSNQDVSTTTGKTSQTETFLKGTLIEPSIDTPSPKRKRHTYSPEFEAWWSLYPKREGTKGSKFEASKAWAKAVALVSVDALTAAVKAYVRSQQVRNGFAKDGVTWLNQRCWEEFTSDSSGPFDPTEWLRGEWNAGRVRDIEERTGLHYSQPDLPAGLTEKAAIEDWLRGTARKWIAENRDLILARLTERRTA